MATNKIVLELTIGQARLIAQQMRKGYEAWHDAMAGNMAYRIERKIELALALEARLMWARSRCANPKNKDYPNYGGRGIKCLLTSKEIKRLWDRDGAAGMLRPSLDRIDNDGNYTFENCRFLEMSENSARRRNAVPRKSGVCGKGHKLTEDNIYLQKDYRNGRFYPMCRQCRRDYDRKRGK